MGLTEVICAGATMPLAWAVVARPSGARSTAAQHPRKPCLLMGRSLHITGRHHVRLRRPWASNTLHIFSSLSIFVRVWNICRPRNFVKQKILMVRILALSLLDRTRFLMKTINEVAFCVERCGARCLKTGFF